MMPDKKYLINENTNEIDRCWNGNKLINMIMLMTNIFFSTIVLVGTSDDGLVEHRH